MDPNTKSDVVVEAEAVGQVNAVPEIKEAEVVKPVEPVVNDVKVETREIKEKMLICPKCGEMMDKAFVLRELGIVLPAPKIYADENPSEEEKVASEIKIPPEANVLGDMEYYTARANEMGDKVYLIANNKKFWIKNPETLMKLGLPLGKERSVQFNDLLVFPEGQPIDMTIPGVDLIAVKKLVEAEIPPKSTAPTKKHEIWA